jgi:hypothetical protein
MEQSNKRNRFEKAVDTWGHLEVMPNEMKLAILSKLPLNDLIIMQQVSKSSYEYIESENLIQKWFDTYLGPNKLASSWILQKLIERNDFSLEHVTGETHVFITGQASAIITLDIEDDKNKRLYNTIMSIATILNIRRGRDRYSWTCEVQNNRSGLTFIYNYLYRIMNLDEMVPNPKNLNDAKLSALEEMSRENQIKTTNFDLFYELQPSKEMLLEWERLHLGSNDRIRQLIMFYLAFEKKFVLVDRLKNVGVVVEWKKNYPARFSRFHIFVKEEFTTDLLYKSIVGGGGGGDKRDLLLMSKSKYHARLIPLMYDWMTRCSLRLIDFEGQEGRVLK